MAFSGYLLKIDGVTFPMKYIQLNSYKSTPNQKMDLDTYRDANGVLHRNVLSHKASKIEFNTPYLHLVDKITMQSFFANRETVSVTYWNDETNSYTTGTFYVPDLVFEINHTTNTDIIYNPIRIAFIEY